LGSSCMKTNRTARPVASLALTTSGESVSKTSTTRPAPVHRSKLLAPSRYPLALHPFYRDTGILCPQPGNLGLLLGLLPGTKKGNTKGCRGSLLPEQQDMPLGSRSPLQVLQPAKLQAVAPLSKPPTRPNSSQQRKSGKSCCLLGNARLVIRFRLLTFAKSWTQNPPPLAGMRVRPLRHQSE
jgi:hypothetical protein